MHPRRPSTAALVETAKKLWQGVEDARRQGEITQAEADHLSLHCADFLGSLSVGHEDRPTLCYSWADLDYLYRRSPTRGREHGIGANLPVSGIDWSSCIVYVTRSDWPQRRFGVRSVAETELGSSLGRFEPGNTPWGAGHRYCLHIGLEPTGFRSSAGGEAEEHSDGEPERAPVAPTAESNSKQALRRRTAELRSQFTADLARLHELGQPS